MPAAEVDIDEGLVWRLLASQFPDWAGWPIEAVRSAGWDNAIYRLGSDLVVRLPRRQMGADLVAKEHRWLPELARRLPLPIPVPIGKGVADDGFPWLWSVCPWMPGTIAAAARIDDFDAVAATLGTFVGAMHEPSPPDAPRSAWRGVPLAQRDENARDAMSMLRGVVDVHAAAAAWEDALAAPVWSGPDVWLHGDLHPANMLVDHGRLSAVLDFGDLAVGDPATDLVSGWMLLPAEARPILRDIARVDEATWDRARGWALSMGLACMAYSADNPVIARIGRRAVEAVLAEHRAD